MADYDLVKYLKKHNLHNWAVEVSNLREAKAERNKLLERVKEAEAANELDRTRVARALTSLNATIKSRMWALEGRGPYEWDDDDYRAEFSIWVEEVEEAAKLFAVIARDWHGCPMDQTEIRHARAMLAVNERGDR